MKTVILTGGIATGKSTALSQLKEIAADFAYYSCDNAVSKWLDSGELVEELISTLGSDSVLPGGTANRDYIRNLIFHDSAARKRLENILHPRIRQECLALREELVKNDVTKGFVIEVPLFFEGKTDYKQDLVVVVSLSPREQRERLSRRNGFAEETVSAILKAQLPLSRKEKQADVVLWNGGDPSWLQKQVASFYHHYFL